MSFETLASEVRDETNTTLVRSRALRKCVSRFHPLGYNGTLEYLKQTVGYEIEWTSDQLLQAIDELAVPHDAYGKFMAEWTERRCALKARGYRSPTAEERAELCSRAWLAWPEVPKSAQIRVAPRFEAIPFRENRRADYLALLAVLPKPQIEGPSTFAVRVYDDVLAIPYRIYNSEVPADVVASLSLTQQMMLHCLFTRHHDGFVRQRHLAWLLGAEEPWVVPYVVALIGEYVVEIVHDIEQGLRDLENDDKRRRLYGRFAADNPHFLELTRNRVASYWDEYHSFAYQNPARKHLERADSQRAIYPGFRLVALLQSVSERL